MHGPYGVAAGRRNAGPDQRWFQPGRLIALFCRAVLALLVVLVLIGILSDGPPDPSHGQAHPLPSSAPAAEYTHTGDRADSIPE